MYFVFSRGIIGMVAAVAVWFSCAAMGADDSVPAVRYSTGYYVPGQQLLVTAGESMNDSGAGSPVPVEAEVGDYCFVLVDRVSDDLRAVLDGPGIRFLGIHGDRLCLIVAADNGSRSRLEETDGVVWVGMPPGELRNAVTGSLYPEESGRGIPSEEVDVVVHLFEPDLTGEDLHRLEEAGLQSGRSMQRDRAYMGTTWLNLCNSIASLPSVKFLEPVRICSGSVDRSACIMGADFTRAGGLTGAGIRVAILDSGYYVDHVDLPDDVTGNNFVGGVGISDEHGHGTHTAGTIFGRGIGLSWLTGIAPGISDIYICKVLDHTGDSVGSSIEEGLSWVAERSSQIDVANLSLGGPGLNLPGTDYLSREADYTAQTGVCVVVAAGNEYEEFNYQDGSVTYPGVSKNSLTVGSVNDDSSSNDPFEAGADRISSFSGRGPTGDGRSKPDVVAPGSLIAAAMAGAAYGYQEMAGTSMATAAVTGVIAQLLEKFPEMDGHPDLIRAYLMATAQDLGKRSEDQGAGRVDAFAALTDDSNHFHKGWFQGEVSDNNQIMASVAEHPISVPDGAAGLRVFLIWHEPPASAGAGQAVLNNLDLLVERIPEGDVSEESVSLYDNVESVILQSPPGGDYRIRVTASELAFGQASQSYAVAYFMAMGDRGDQIGLELAVPEDRIAIGETFTVSATLSTSSASTAAVEAIIDIPRECLIEWAAIRLSDGTTTEFDYDTPYVYQEQLSSLTPGELSSSAGPRQIDWHIRAFASVAYEIEVSARSIRHAGVSASDLILIGDAEADQVLGEFPDDPSDSVDSDTELQPSCGNDPTSLFLLSGLFICCLASSRRRRVFRYS
ncbi:MAG: S8 family peptidase [Planctomycetota bacterium]|jgi:subtilisin family serine protease